MSDENDVVAPTRPQYWRSLDAAAGNTPASRREFPDGADVIEVDDVTRRQFLGIMGASLALAGLSGSACSAIRKPAQEILPYAKRPEDLVPGMPQYFATTAFVGGSVLGLLAKSQDGRPIKVEGNPAHPGSLGGTNAWAQAEVLCLYDPDRSGTPFHGKGAASWDEALGALRGAIDAAKTAGGLGIVMDSRPSPTRRRLVDSIAQQCPGTKLFRTDAWADAAAREAAALVGHAGDVARVDLSTADVIVAIDCDFLGTDGDVVRHARAFASRRVPESPDGARMNRLYVVEPSFSTTGTRADHRLRAKASQGVDFLAALAAQVGLPADAASVSTGRTLAGADAFVAAAASDLKGAGARAVVLVGPRQPAAVHALAALINESLGAVGTTVTWLPDPLPKAQGVVELAAALRAGEVKTLVFLGVNPVYEAAPELGLAELVKAAPFSAHVGNWRDETAAACTWHLAASHWLETWDDLVGSDGRVSFTQPLIAPIHGTSSDNEILARALGDNSDGRALVMATWGFGATGPSEGDWRTALQTGVTSLTPAAVAQATPAPTAAAVPSEAAPAAPAATRDLAVLSAGLAAAAPGEGLELNIVLHPCLADGRYSNNAWMQELPDPMTKLTWGDAAAMSPATAKRLGVSFKERDPLVVDRVTVTLGGRSLELPGLISPGLADDVVVLTMGGGRQDLGRVAKGVGVNACELRQAASPWFAAGATVARAAGRSRLYSTQEHGDLTEPSVGPAFIHPDTPVVRGDLVRETTIAAWAANPQVVRELDVIDPVEEKSLFKDTSPDITEAARGQQWGMAIDLSACVGCNACTIACQAENNIPVVGAERVEDGREMHWIRLDRYYSGSEEDPKAVHQPIPCMQCENAPCEQVCPVAATTHSEDGLNDMAYNRCIGTRYCANNCPYKVRRFNYFNFAAENDAMFRQADTKDDQGYVDKAFQHDAPATLISLQRNPDVTVRFRGVMEKCTYCVQRISRARIDAKVHGDGLVPDGGVTTACQQACPAGAIVFGDLSDTQSRVSRVKASPRNYRMLAELNTQPRTSYLARVHNPNETLEPPAAAPSAHEAAGEHHG